MTLVAPQPTTRVDDGPAIAALSAAAGPPAASGPGSV
jgi:hypothetical protein